MMIQEFDDLRSKGKKKKDPENVIKTCGHCYDGCGWQMCDWWYIDKKERSRCAMFGNAIKYASESLIICNKMYSHHYEGKP